MLQYVRESLFGSSEAPVDNPADNSFKDFDMSRIDSDRTVLIIGRSGTGKTTMIKNILQNLREPFQLMCINPMERFKGEYASLVPTGTIYHEFSKEALRNLYQENKQKGVVVIDNCITGTHANSRELRELIQKGKDRGIPTIIAISCAVELPPALRPNIDYVFLLAEPMNKQQLMLWERYAGIFSDFETFRQVFNRMTENYGAMVIDNTSNSAKLEDMVFTYKANA